MNCAEFSKIVHDLARSQGVPGTQDAMARAHAEACPSCAYRLAEAEQLAAMLKSASAESRSLNATESTELALIAAFRDASASKFDGSRRGRPRWQRVLGWASAAAVIALLAFEIFGRTVYPSRPLVSSNMNGGASAVARAGYAHAKLADLPQTAVSEPTTGFVPVPFAGGFARGDSGVIVRVQVPPSALAELGYPADELQGQGMVQADLLVGEDGWPRAVRIVKESSER